MIFFSFRCTLFCHVPILLFLYLVDLRYRMKVVFQYGQLWMDETERAYETRGIEYLSLQGIFFLFFCSLPHGCQRLRSSTERSPRIKSTEIHCLAWEHLKVLYSWKRFSPLTVMPHGRDEHEQRHSKGQREKDKWLCAINIPMQWHCLVNLNCWRVHLEHIFSLFLSHL